MYCTSVFTLQPTGESKEFVPVHEMNVDWTEPRPMQNPTGMHNKHFIVLCLFQGWENWEKYEQKKSPPPKENVLHEILYKSTFCTFCENLFKRKWSISNFVTSLKPE